MADTTVIVPDGFELKAKTNTKIPAANGASKKTKLETTLTSKEKAAQELIEECLHWDDFEQALWVLREEGYHLRIKPVSDGKYLAGQRSIVLDQLLNEVEQSQTTIYEHLSNAFGRGDFSILIYSRKNTVYIKARHPLIEFIPNPLSQQPSSAAVNSSAAAGVTTAAAATVTSNSQIWTAFVTAAVPALISAIEKIASRPPTSNDNTQLIMKLIETSEARTEKMIDRVESGNDIIEHMERVDELRDRFSKPASAMMPPIAGAGAVGAAGAAKAGEKKDVWERALETGLGIWQAKQQQQQPQLPQQYQQQQPEQPIQQQYQQQQPEQPIQQQYQQQPQPQPQPPQPQQEEAQLEKIEEMINNNPRQILDQIDQEITQQLKEETDVIQILASIRDYLKFASEHELLSEITELRNANFDVEAALDLYLATRTYNQQYKDSITAACQGFIPTLQKMVGEPEPEPEPEPEEITPSPADLSALELNIEDVEPEPEPEEAKIEIESIELGSDRPSIPAPTT